MIQVFSEIDEDNKCEQASMLHNLVEYRPLCFSLRWKIWHQHKDVCERTPTLSYLGNISYKIEVMYLGKITQKKKSHETIEFFKLILHSLTPLIKRLCYNYSIILTKYKISKSNVYMCLSI